MGLNHGAEDGPGTPAGPYALHDGFGGPCGAPRPHTAERGQRKEEEKTNSSRREKVGPASSFSVHRSLVFSVHVINAGGARREGERSNDGRAR